jgi:hypothetical protein
MGHRDLRATAKYVENLSPQEERELLGWRFDQNQQSEIRTTVLLILAILAAC